MRLVGYLKRNVRDHCVYNLYSVHLCAFVVTIILYIRLMFGSLIIKSFSFHLDWTTLTATYARSHFESNSLGLYVNRVNMAYQML